ncbi:MAG: hypothetical protein K6F00_10325, partial [Lachnospiraceae bacterium]|nr:hypothetical protein [Lachnospiraceae bacterium]
MTSSNVSNVPFTPVQPVREKKSNSKDQNESLDFYNMMQSSITKDMPVPGGMGNKAGAAPEINAASKTDSFAVGAPVKSDAKMSTENKPVATEEKRDMTASKSTETGKSDKNTVVNEGEAPKEEKVTEEEKEVINEALSVFGQDVINLITENLNVSEEEITSAMEDMNLTFSDLTVPGKFTELISHLTGNEDPMAMLTMEGGKELLEGF